MPSLKLVEKSSSGTLCPTQNISCTLLPASKTQVPCSLDNGHNFIYLAAPWLLLFAEARVSFTLSSIGIHVLYKIYIYIIRTVSDIQCSSVQFSRSVMSDSLGPHELQHARPV